jgi:hypothetical protein
MPEYSAARREPNSGLPPDLAQAEQGPAFIAQRQEIERALREAPRQPQTERPHFVELLAGNLGGVVTTNLRKRAIAIGETLGLYRDYPVSKACTSSFAPIWTKEIVGRKG